MSLKTKTALRIAAAVLLGAVLGVLYSPGSPGFLLGILVGFGVLEGFLALISRPR